MEEKEVGYGRRLLESMFRFVPFALCITSLVVMLKTKQTNQYGTLEYNNIGAFRYLAYANGICGAFSLVFVLESAIRWPCNSNLCRSWIAFLSDQIMTYMMVAAVGVGTEVLYLAKKGDESVTWVEVCSIYGGFCNRAMVSLIINFVNVLCFIAFSVFSAHRLFSKYDPPYVNSDNGVESQTIG